MFIASPAQPTDNDEGEAEGRIEDAPKHASRHAGPRRQQKVHGSWSLRPKSVRAKIVSLLMVPVISLMALWGFATVTTARSVSEIQRFQEVNATLLAPVNDVITAVEVERSAASRHLAASGDARIENVETAGEATDAALDELRAGVNASSTEIAALDDELPGRIDAFVAATRDLAVLRDEVIFREVSWDAAYEQYTSAIEAGFGVDGGLATLRPHGESGTDGSDPRVVLELAHAREALSQEDAYMGAAHAAGEMSQEQYNAVVGAAEARDTFLRSAIPDLQPGDQANYDEILSSEAYRRLTELEQIVRDEGWGESAVAAVPEAMWRDTVSAVLDAMIAAEASAGTGAVAAADPFGLDVLGGSGLAVVLGLAGLVLSLFISVQIGRGLIVDLVDLRNSAMDLAGKKLPQALKRLHTGVEIDVDKEAPIQRMQGDEGEVAQVAEALNAVHRSALQSAVERAEALSGISAVYVYLARRSQVLLHRQLALLDQMERRIDDPDELEDLFRLDHLTTRMRRLAESLIILSGAAPARGWRKPVPLLDVVRASIAEVEDFTRVDVHELPEIRMAGSSVADITHLLAELIENAVVFSPPHTQARVRGELVGAGLALEIEDRGLGMSPEALADANRRIDDADQVDLLETDQLGLFVVNRLAHRHNVRVTLQESAYGGITAVVLIPETLIDRSAELPDDSEVRRSSRGTASRGTAPSGNGAISRARALPPARVAAPVPPPVSGIAANGSDPGWRVPWAPEERSAARNEPISPTGLSPDVGDPDVPEPPIHEVTAVGDATAPGQPGLGHERDGDADDGTGGLPKRIRQANLAPQLREPATEGGQADEGEDSAPRRTPDEARATMAALRSGWLRGQGDVSADEQSAEELSTDHGAQGEGN